MWPFGKSENQKKLIMIFDISSGSVGGAFVSFVANKNSNIKSFDPVILGQARTEMKYQDELDFEKFSFYMNKALYETAEKLMMLKIGRPEKIYCFLSSPWHVCQTRVIHMEKEKTFITTKKIVNDLIEVELKNIVSEYNNKYKGSLDTPKLIENVVLESSVNGYKVSDLYDKKAKMLDIVIYLSVSPESVLIGADDSIAKVFPHTPISFNSFSLSFYNAIRLKYPGSNSHLLIDVNAEITDVGIVSDGILTSFFSFPIGRNYIIRKIMKKKSVSRDQAESLFKLYASNTLEKKTKEDMDTVMGEIELLWKNIFYRSIADLSKLSGYTDLVYLVSHLDSSLYFTNILRNPNVPLKILGDRKFSVVTLTGEDLKSMCKVESGGCDEFLMSEALSLAYVYRA